EPAAAQESRPGRRDRSCALQSPCSSPAITADQCHAPSHLQSRPPSLRHSPERNRLWRVKRARKELGSWEDTMANLIMPDTFDPYYSGREDEAERGTKPRPQKKKKIARQAD